MKKIQNISVQVISGDMTSIKADAYIVPQFNNCTSYGGVGGAVNRAGACTGMKSYDEIVRSGRQDFGSAFLVPSGGGLSKFLLHVVSVGSGERQEFETVQKSIFSALKLADDAGLKSILCPALGTGIIGDLTDEQSAKAILSAIAKFAEVATSLEEFSIVIYGGRTVYFETVLNSASYQDAKPQRGCRAFDFGRWAANMVMDSAKNHEFEKSHK
ncbi:MAG: macro domain-containing protein [Alphaproteobacteria bacterium]